MTNDRKITITVGASRKATNWQPWTLSLSELYARLSTPARSSETYEAYMAMKKPQQDTLKDVGGFVGGGLNGARRKAGAVQFRDVVSLDLDRIPPGGTDSVLCTLNALGCGFCVYSTRKHSPATPRLRVLFPLDCPCTADEYEPIARRLSESIGLDLADPTTFEVSRLMYWPSCCADSEYVFHTADKPFVSGKGLLDSYENWRDHTQWPRKPEESTRQVVLGSKQENPTEKQGIVGAFCREFTIREAIETFLPGVYEPLDDDRFTYLGGSTVGGAVLYDDGQFLYSHHATDPAGGRLVNAFDLVRIHLFAEQDDEAKEGTPTNRLPSFLSMCTLAADNDRVSARMYKERSEQLKSDFAGLENCTPVEDNGEWFKTLDKSGGAVTNTIDNAWKILENDPMLTGKFGINDFAGRVEVLEPLPWNAGKDRRFWDENDLHGLIWYMEKRYQLRGEGRINSALSLYGNHHKFNEVAEYLNGLTWDSVRRLDTLLIRYLGATDSEYVRFVTRKTFVAAVARALSPGIKFDTVLVLSGAQGLGKSTLVQKMGRGWGMSGISSFEGKDATELIQGRWIVELDEMDTLQRSDVNRVKQFITQTVDRFRAAYGREVRDCPRCCIFIGTCNNREFLRDSTGGRRFWPVDVGEVKPACSIFETLDGEIDQLWAEAVSLWRTGEPLFLTAEQDDMARKIQEAHREISPKEGIIRDFLDQKIPKDWQAWPLARRIMYWQDSIPRDNLELVERDRVCALEVWCEALNMDLRYIKNSDTREINQILARFTDWKPFSGVKKFGYCKTQRGYQKQ